MICRLAALTLLAVAGAAAAGPLKRCHLPGISNWARCGSLEVPENWDAPDRRIKLRVAVLPAVQHPPEPDPIFVLAGGPGQSAVAIAPMMKRLLGPANRARDIVLVDQRGSGGSSPFRCDFDPATLTAGAAAWREVARSCLDDFDGEAGRYGTLDYVSDLEAVRAWLGYEQINLYGGSYGTRVGLVYQREHAERIRAAVLDGVAPMDMRVGLEMGADAQRALDLLARRCLEDPGCRERFGDPRETLDQLQDALSGTPLELTFTDPATGREDTEEITADMVGLGLRGLLYAPETQRLIPLVLDAAEGGDWSPFLGLSMANSRQIAEVMNVGLLLAVLCSEDLAGLDRDAIGPAERASFVGTAQAGAFLDMCTLWPEPLAPLDWNLPPSRVPTLLLSGALDPVTPPARAEAAARSLEVSRHVVVPNAGHIVAGAGCMPDVVATFYATPDPHELDADCIADHPAPSFFLSRLGPVDVTEGAP